MAGGGKGQYRENVQTFRKGVCSPLGPRLLPLKLWLLHLTKRTNLELWLFLTIPISSFGWNGEHFMQSLGHKGDDGGIQVASEMSQIFSLLLIWVKTDWTQPVSCNFTTEKEIYLVPLTERLHPILIISRSQSILKEKCGLLFPRW